MSPRALRESLLPLMAALALLFGGLSVAAAQDDAGTPDAGAPDAGAPDAGAPDAGTDAPDAGTSEDEEWSEEDEEWSEEDEEWAEEDEDEDEDEEPAEPEAEEEEAEPEEAAEEEEAEPEEGADVEVGEDDESVEGQEGGLLPEQPPIGYRPPIPPSGDNDFQLVFPPVLYSRQGASETIAGFPLFYYRNTIESEAGPASEELAIPPYYFMRGEENWDVLFPLFWWYRGEGHHTWVVPPVWHHESEDGFDFGVAPLVFAGRHGHHHYTIIPALLTLDWGAERERFTFVANFWRVQEPTVEHWGLFPFLWVENAEGSSYTIAPPLFFRFTDEEEGTELTVIPPFYHRNESTGSYFGLPPLFHHNSGPGHTSTTIFPLLSHYSEEADAFRLVIAGTFWYFRDHGDETIITPVYQRFRGATELDAVAPIFFHIRDPRTDSLTLMVTPLFWHIEDPGSVNTVVFPFFGRFEERGRQTTWLTPLFGQHTNHELGDETTWVFPTLQVSRWHNGDAVNFHPLFYYESVSDHQHSVVFPFWWDFEDYTGDQNRYTVAFPFFWRFREGNTTSTLVLNMYHRERTRSDSSEWEFHFFPFFSYGESSTGGHWWKIFYGLFGYERRGQYGVTTLFYVPFQTDGPALTPDE